MGNDGEYDDTRGLTSQQVLEWLKKGYKDQDQDLDEIAMITGGIKQDANNINEELDV